MTSRPTKSVRFAQLKTAVNQALLASRKTFDIDLAIKEIYGDDANIFGGGTRADSAHDDGNNTNALVQVFESVLETIHDESMECMNKVLREEEVEKVLLKLETITAKLQAEQAFEEELEQVDKQSAQDAADNATREEDMKPRAILNAKALEELMSEREALQKELDAVKEEEQQLLEQCRQKEAEIRVLSNQVYRDCMELEKAADVASTIDAL